MAIWKKVEQVFRGGTQAALALKNSRVRTRTNLIGMRLNDAVRPGKIDVPNAAIGIISHAEMDDVLIGFAKGPPEPTTLDALVKHKAGFYVIRVNWPTFKAQFDIES